MPKPYNNIKLKNNELLLKKKYKYILHLECLVLWPSLWFKHMLHITLLINHNYYRCPHASPEIHLNSTLHSKNHKEMIILLEKLHFCIILVKMQTIFRPQLFKKVRKPLGFKLSCLPLNVETAQQKVSSTRPSVDHFSCFLLYQNH